MNSGRVSQKVAVERRYKAHEENCAQAIKLLLQKPARASGGEDDAKGLKNDRATVKSSPNPP